MPNAGTVFGLVSVTVPSAFKIQPPVAVAETLRESAYDLCAANGMSCDLVRLCFGSNLELGLFMKPVPIPSALRGDVVQRVQELLPEITGEDQTEVDAHIQEWMELQEAFDSAKARRLAAASKPARFTRSTPKKQKGAASKKASGQG